MALKIERYRLVGDYDENEMEPDEDGEWVKYEDHEDMMVLAERRQVQEPEKAPDWLVQVRAETAEARVREVEANVEHWRAAWHEGDALRTKLQARIDELVGERRDADARARRAETELAEARAKLSSVGWVHDEMRKAAPGWKRAFAAHAGERWDRGETTAPEQLAFVLNKLVERARYVGRPSTPPPLDAEEG